MDDTLDPARPSGGPPPRAPPPTVPPPPNPPGSNGLLTLTASVVIVVSLYLARAVLIPVTLAVLLSFLLAPLVHRLHRLGLGRVTAAMVAALLALGVILALVGLIGTEIAGLAGQVPRYESIVEHKIETIREIATEKISAFSNRFSLQPTGAPTTPARPKTEAAEAPPASPAQPFTLSVLGIAERILPPVVSPLATAGIVIVVTIFILLQWEDLRDRMIRLLAAGDLRRTTLAFDEAGRLLSRYFLAQLTVNACYGCVIGVGLALIGVPKPVLWGVIAMLFRFVPYIGTPLAAVLVAALAAAVSPGWGKAIGVVALFTGVEVITGNAVEPLVYGSNTGLSPFAVIVAAIFWAWIWGPIGLLLSTPLTVWAVTFARHVKRFEFLHILLSDRPALTPAQGFYDRLLANDVDEAAAEAESLLRDRSLAAYYDEVALPGLRLATADTARGVLAPDQLGRLRQALERLLADLADHAAPRAAPAEPASARILCIAGRGPLDDFASGMLAQLFEAQGLAARLVPHESLGRARVAELASYAPAVACLCYLDPPAAEAHLRAVIRRLRDHLPETAILSGFWPPERGGEREGSPLGADRALLSLQEAIDVARAEIRVRPAAAARTAAGSARGAG